MILLRNKEISVQKWKNFLAFSHFSTSFQTPEFYELCNSVPGLSAQAFALEEDNKINALCVVILQKEQGLKGFFSRRAIIYGGPVLDKKDSEVGLEYLLNSINKEYNGRSIYIESRNLNDYNIYRANFQRNNWRYIPYQDYLVDCSDKQKMFNNLGNNRKREIKKAIKSGVFMKEAENIFEVYEFYKILEKLYVQKIKKPLFSKIFFEEIFNKCFGKYLLVMYENKIIGGILCPIIEGRYIYEFYVCGLDEEFKEQYPSTMATWAAMEYANRNNIPVFDFMGAGRKDKYYGVREFKSRFGGELVEHGRYIKIYNPILYEIGVFALKLKRKLG
jgi:serine/alanine adding enzyme